MIKDSYGNSTWYNPSVPFEDLIGETFTEVVSDNYEYIIFHHTSGRKFKMYHRQDCCESVNIESIVGDLDDLTNTPITFADVSSNEGNTGYDDSELYNNEGSSTWTFYKLATIKGFVDIRWFGSSNGYYSESVDFEEITNERG